MSFIEAILLAILQGATEFVPVSSSGHLLLGETFLGVKEPQLLFTVTLHLGTLLAVMLFYRRQIMTLITDVMAAAADGLHERSLGAFRQHEGARLAVLLVLATIPTAVLGLGMAAWPAWLRWLLLTGGVVAQASVLNSFSHFHTPVLVSLERTVVALAIGLVVGLVALVVARWLTRGLSAWLAAPDEAPAARAGTGGPAPRGAATPGGAEGPLG